MADINKKQFDANRDGTVTEEEIQQVRSMVEIELHDQKANTQKKMAWVALFSMLFFTCILFSPIIADSRVSALADLLGLFYIAQAGVVGAYMGVTAWMSRN
jgi:ABC-type multidrug transport system permease subunit